MTLTLIFFAVIGGSVLLALLGLIVTYAGAAIAYGGCAVASGLFVLVVIFLAFAGFVHLVK